MASKTSAISCALYFSVPLKSRCSMKWETPARSWRSSLDPAPIQNPSATERTCVSRSVTTRWPESSSERTYFCTDGSYWRPRLLALREPCHETARPAAAGSVTHPGLSHSSGWTKDLNTHGAIRADGHVLTYEEVSST